VHAQAMADQPRRRRVENTAQNEATARRYRDDLLFVIGGATLWQRSKPGPLQLDTLAVVGNPPTDDLVDEAAVGIEIGIRVLMRASASSFDLNIALRLVGEISLYAASNSAWLIVSLAAMVFCVVVMFALLVCVAWNDDATGVLRPWSPKKCRCCTSRKTDGMQRGANATTELNHDDAQRDLVRSGAGVDTEPHLHRRSSFGVIF
jgi:hypothetical protein